VDAFNRALEEVELGAPDPATSLVAAGGRFSVAQLVHDVPSPDGPPGDVRTVLAVDAGRAHLALGEPEAPPDVTVSLSYADAAALSRGTLAAAEALGAGRVRVRGDLAVLVAGQELLATAAGALADLHADTTY
jgi:hypothetical protein